MCRQGVEDGSLLGGLADAQLVLGAPQQESPAVTIRQRIHLAGRQVLQALPSLLQGRVQRGNFRVRIGRRTTKVPGLVGLRRRPASSAGYH